VPYAKNHALQRNDPVRIVAPAGPFDRASFEAGLTVLASRYRPTFSQAIFERSRYLAGPDRTRLADLSAALEDRQANAVFCARGGYGSMRLLRALHGRPPPHRPFVGFSDLTAVHLWLQSRGLMSLHAPVMTQLSRQPGDVVERLFHWLEQPMPPAPLTGARTFVGGTAEGPLIGGNMTVLTSMLGTPYLPDFRGAILLLEDVGERPYRLDRMWAHLDLAGVLDQVAGVVLGTFTSCEERDADFTPLDVLVELANDKGVPCAGEFPIGHGAVNQPVALGARVRLDASAGTLTFLEALVEPRG
jgi:muramoyltetrapeptide carboxypeptidase